jgi:hypothetical protein
VRPSGNTPSPRQDNAGGTRADASAPPAPEKKGFDFSQFTKVVQQGIDFAKFGVTTAQQFGGARGGGGAGAPPPSPTTAPTSEPVPGTEPEPQPAALTPPAPDAPATAAPGSPDQLAVLLQAMQQRQIPSLPGSPSPAVTTAPQATAAAPRLDGLALLHAILSNPQFQTTLRSASTGMPARTVYLPMPVPAQPHYQQQMPIPLGAVMNAIAQLATRSMTEITEGTDEEASPMPAYLVDEDGEYLVDPANGDDRAALVAHLFRVNAAAARSRPVNRGMQLNDSDTWAREAGFI